MINDRRDETTPPFAEQYPLDVPPPREISLHLQNLELQKKIRLLESQRRMDLEAMEAAQSRIVHLSDGDNNAAFLLLEARTGWFARTSQFIECGGPLEGDDAS